MVQIYADDPCYSTYVVLDRLPKVSTAKGDRCVVERTDLWDTEKIAGCGSSDL